MTADKPNDLGDVHAPVEDTDVPATLKFLVILMIIVMVGLAVLIGLAISQPGLFNG
jgi:hypothetical protein